MKVGKNQLANALGLTTAVSWVVCSLFIALFPNLAETIVTWWLHGRDVSVLGSYNLNFSNFLLGGVTLTVAGWLFGYLLGWSLKYFEK